MLQRVGEVIGILRLIMVLTKETDTIRVILCVLLWGGNDTDQMGRWARVHFPPFHICTFTHSLMIGL